VPAAWAGTPVVGTITYAPLSSAAPVPTLGEWSLALMALLLVVVLAVLVYSLVALAVSTASHGNLRLPAALDRWLWPWVETPAYHRLHHSAHQPQTDSNYATVLPLFDHLLRSAGEVPGDAGQLLTMGLRSQRDAASQTVWALLRAPFRD